MSKDDRQVRIDAYLLGSSDANERKELEEEVSRNAELSAQLADTELAIAAIELAEDQALKARLQALEAGLSEQKVPTAATTTEAGKAKVVTMQPRKSRRQWYGIAAAVLLLLVAGWFLLQPRGYASPEALAMATFEPYENITNGTVRGDATDTATVAFAAYDAGQYAEAVEAFKGLPNTPVNKFYLAQSLLANEQYTAAATQFTDLTKADFGLQQEAAYYLALSHLGDGEKAKARALLNDIVGTENHPMLEQAQKLLTELEKLAD